MKKSIIMTLVLALIISLATVVNAAVEVVPATANISLSKPEAKKGDEVTATVSIDAGDRVVDMADLTLSYDSSVLEFVSSNATDVEVGSNSVRLLYLMYGKTTFTATFKVIGEKATDTSITFTPTQLTTTGVEFQINSASASLKVLASEPEKEPEGNNVPGGNITEPENETGSTPEGNLAGNNEAAPENETGRPSRLPQTGVNVAIVGGVVIALVAVAAVVKKMND